MGLSPGWCAFVCLQGDVYRATAQHLVAGVLSGYNATVFAYGPSGTAGGSIPRRDGVGGRGLFPTAQSPDCGLASLASAPLGSFHAATREGR